MNNTICCAFVKSLTRKSEFIRNFNVAVEAEQLELDGPTAIPPCLYFERACRRPAVLGGGMGWGG